MNEIYNATGILNTILMLCMIIGGYIAIKSGKHQQTGTIQSQAIDALQAELESLQRRIEVLEKENTQLEHLIETIKEAISHKGIEITINGEMVTISDSTGNSSTVRKTSRKPQRSED